jgi:GTP-binding protein
MKPVIALVGRPNVGKSTLFNRFTKSRDAIVADFAGLTRDRHYGDGRQPARVHRHRHRRFRARRPRPASSSQMAKQTARRWPRPMWWSSSSTPAGLSAQDHDIARFLRTAGKKRVLLAVNKAEGMVDAPQLAEFHELGMGEPHPVSAAHGQGIRSLLEAALADFPDDPRTWTKAGRTRPADPLAVAGRPNVGKSTLINTWLGEERLVAFDMPGTTRDAISVPF